MGVAFRNEGPDVRSGFDGIYDPPTVARYVSASRRLMAPADNLASATQPVTSRLVRAWARQGLATPDLATQHGRSLVLAFEDLISLRVVHALRTGGCSLQHIRRVEKVLREETGYTLPFARQQVLSNGGREIFTVLDNILVSLSSGGQIYFSFYRDELAAVTAQLTFDANGSAHAWYPTDGVGIEPEVQFGESCVKGTRIPTSALFGMYRAGDSIEYLAASYGISQEQVLDAVRWQEAVASAA